MESQLGLGMGWTLPAQISMICKAFAIVADKLSVVVLSYTPSLFNKIVRLNCQ